MARRQASDPSALLTRARLTNTAAAERLLGSLATALGVGDVLAPLADDLADAADPDQALLELVRLAETHPHAFSHCWRDAEQRALLVRVLGASRALGEIFVRDADALTALTEPAAALERQPDLGGVANTRELRECYYRQLAAIAIADLAAHTPDTMPAVGQAIARLVHAALQAALDLARTRHEGAGHVPLILVAMGKTGGGELNYISDVDLIPVTQVPAGSGLTEEDVLERAGIIVREVIDICSASDDSGQPPLWPIDLNLRPEGRDGPLVKTLDAHRSYYRRWAHTWEFQALLKALPVAGDRELAAAYEAEIYPLAYAAVERENFVADTQAMRRRVEQTLRPRDEDRHIKLGAGGLRDVEFTVQLLQLVHGRTDDTLRVRATIDAIAALAAGGYIGRDAAADLTACYTWLRTLEHRIQLHRLRRSHTLPTAPADLKRLSRLMDCADVTEQWHAVRRKVRSLHEAIFYRPLLPATAQLSAADVALQPEAARDRLTGIGYRDPNAALRHIAALTEGISRRAAIQRQLLPVLLSWFAAGPDPDGGLLAFRKLSDELGSTHWYLGFLRDEGDVAYTLAHCLSRSRFLGEQIVAVPTSVRWLAEKAQLAPRTPAELESEVDAIFSRHHDAPTRALMLRRLRQRELVRAAFADVIEGVSTKRQEAITAVADTIVRYALRAAIAEFADENGRPFTGEIAIIAMGRTGGCEMSYASDVDAVVLYDGKGEHLAADAHAIVGRWRALLADSMAAPALAIDLSLRPEGKSGALTRSVDSYLDYLAHHAEPWEKHALVRARIVEASEDVHARLAAGIDAARYPASGLSGSDLRQIRRIKARMESERLPRGVAHARHVKLGPGGLADVEWAIQLIQLQHGHEHAQLRTPRTREAIDAARELGYVSDDQAAPLLAAWRMASHIRAAATLALRRSWDAIDVLPADAHERELIAGMVGERVAERDEFDEQWARRSRQARAVAEPLIYGT
ncbi:bifunctional [glutamine synthetase] adenylyltransferase/[glutamine synthetase]-adenylyl-L-tyrosine phosphorylase [Bowdeniella nasicola]|nr:bifunctional [glutamine synthetase] adenylyltransferase/[glutamine synthetase]-adenylyl-L-tyrosine phosphorylase [Bowdeniella nasicola]